MEKEVSGMKTKVLAVRCLRDAAVSILNNMMTTITSFF